MSDLSHRVALCAAPTPTIDSGSCEDTAAQFGALSVDAAVDAVQAALEEMGAAGFQANDHDGTNRRREVFDWVVQAGTSAQVARIHDTCDDAAQRDLLLSIAQVQPLWQAEFETAIGRPVTNYGTMNLVWPSMAKFTKQGGRWMNARTNKPAQFNKDWNASREVTKFKSGAGLQLAKTFSNRLALKEFSAPWLEGASTDIAYDLGGLTGVDLSRVRVAGWGFAFPVYEGLVAASARRGFALEFGHLYANTPGGMWRSTATAAVQFSSYATFTVSNDDVELLAFAGVEAAVKVSNGYNAPVVDFGLFTAQLLWYSDLMAGAGIMGGAGFSYKPSEGRFRPLLAFGIAFPYGIQNVAVVDVKFDPAHLKEVHDKFERTYQEKHNLISGTLQVQRTSALLPAAGQNPFAVEASLATYALIDAVGAEIVEGARRSLDNIRHDMKRSPLAARVVEVWDDVWRGASGHAGARDSHAQMMSKNP